MMEAAIVSGTDWPADDAAFLSALAGDDGAASSVPRYALLTARAVHTAVPDPSITAGLRAFLSASRSGGDRCARRLVVTVLERARRFVGLEADAADLIENIIAAHTNASASPLPSAAWRRLRIEAMSLADAKTDAIDRSALEIASALAWSTLVASECVQETIRLLIEGEAESAARTAGIARVPDAELERLHQKFLTTIEPGKTSSTPFWTWLETTYPTVHRDNGIQRACLAAQRRASAKSLLSQVAAFN